MLAASVLEKCIAECETSTASLLAEGLESLHRLRDKCVFEDSSKGSHSCKIDKESLKELDKLQTSMRILERKMKVPISKSDLNTCYLKHKSILLLPWGTEIGRL